MKIKYLRNRQNNEGPIELFSKMVMDLDIDELIRENLRRLIKEKGLKQNYIAQQIGIKPSQISDLLSGANNMGKDIMTRLCKVLKVDPWEFYWTEKTPIISNPREAERVYLHREEEKLGITEEIIEFEKYKVDRAKRIKINPEDDDLWDLIDRPRPPILDRRKIKKSA